MVDRDLDYGLPQPGVMGEDPELHNQLVWYGVLHVEGGLKVKRYYGWGDYKEAGDSDFTAYVTRLFPAETKEAAMAEAQRQVTARYIL